MRDADIDKVFDPRSLRGIDRSTAGNQIHGPELRTFPRSRLWNADELHDRIAGMQVRRQTRRIERIGLYDTTSRY